jgi:hypothetical protein
MLLHPSGFLTKTLALSFKSLDAFDREFNRKQLFDAAGVSNRVK